MFHLQENQGILDSPWCNSPLRIYQKLGEGDFYSFDVEKFPFLSSYLLPTHNKNKCLPN